MLRSESFALEELIDGRWDGRCAGTARGSRFAAGIFRRVPALVAAIDDYLRHYKTAP